MANQKAAPENHGFFGQAGTKLPVFIVSLLIASSLSPAAHAFFGIGDALKSTEKIDYLSAEDGPPPAPPAYLDYDVPAARGWSQYYTRPDLEDTTYMEGSASKVMRPSGQPQDGRMPAFGADGRPVLNANGQPVEGYDRLSRRGHINKNQEREPNVFIGQAGTQPPSMMEPGLFPGADSDLGVKTQISKPRQSWKNSGDGPNGIASRPGDFDYGMAEGENSLGGRTIAQGGNQNDPYANDPLSRRQTYEPEFRGDNNPYQGPEYPQRPAPTDQTGQADQQGSQQGMNPDSPSGLSEPMPNYMRERATQGAPDGMTGQNTGQNANQYSGQNTGQRGNQNTGQGTDQNINRGGLPPMADDYPTENANPQVPAPMQQAGEAGNIRYGVGSNGQLPNRYVVQQGDSLSGISDQGQIYGDWKLWPLIYDANREQIKDPDLIYPEQDFAIPRDSNQPQRNNAYERAEEHRIEWFKRHSR